LKNNFWIADIILILAKVANKNKPQTNQKNPTVFSECADGIKFTFKVLQLKLGSNRDKVYE
jgi:hypothetical protein